MNVVIEGPDKSGKSTLARMLSQLWGMEICECTDYPSISNQLYLYCNKISRYRNTIFDGHPCIAEVVYASAIQESCSLPIAAIREFQETHPFIIYTRPDYSNICRLYDNHMMSVAHYIYRHDDPYLGYVPLPSLLGLANPGMIAHR